MTTYELGNGANMCPTAASCDPATARICAMTVASKQATAGHSNQLNDYIAADAEAKITEAYQSNSSRIDAMEDPQLRAIMQRSMASMAANVRSIANTDTESVVRCNEPSRGLLGKKCTAEVVKVHKSKGRY